MAFIDFSKRGSIRIALNRFEKTFNDICPEDQIIDYMIAFEALFIGKKSREQRAVIPIAAAMLLGKDDEDRQKIIQTLDYAYELRNYIVHGSGYKAKLSKDKRDLDELNDQLGIILRDSLKKLL